MELADGAFIFLAVILVWFASIIYGLYTVRGSGINQRSYGNRYSSAPGANKIPSVLSHDESAATRFTRGTR
jgi:hypothetical protein